jgi:hypothetical protein
LDISGLWRAGVSVVGSDLLVAILAGLCGTMLWDNKGSWLQWRRRLDQITQGDGTSIVKFPGQSWIKENGRELISTAAMLIALAVFCWLNPFQAEDCNAARR